MPGDRPDLAETLDAPVYEPPNGNKFRSALIRRLALLALTGVAVVGVTGFGTIWFLSRQRPSAVKAGCTGLINDARTVCESYKLENGCYPWGKA